MQFPSHPSALSFDSRQLWIGSKGGGVHIMDMTTGTARELQVQPHASLFLPLSILGPVYNLSMRI